MGTPSNVLSVNIEDFADRDLLVKALSEDIRFVKINIPELQNIISFIELMERAGVIVLDSNGDIVKMTNSPDILENECEENEI
ncbi:hypothetical protein KKF34_18385 [Myxococcota bacterium]|nr:hypothetical protein [Myxococcota bacterium]MBU1381583.1 hypothetical protein [Myxococcota bacterium]MBU1498853.1 hypothetical protein [Myxococcota bacterium]